MINKEEKDIKINLEDIDIDPSDDNGPVGGVGASAMASIQPKVEPINIGITNEDLIKNINESVNKGFMQGGGR